MFSNFYEAIHDASTWAPSHNGTAPKAKRNIRWLPKIMNYFIIFLRLSEILLKWDFFFDQRVDINGGKSSSLQEIKGTN